MTFSKTTLVLSGLSLAAALFFVPGCGGPDNEAAMATTTDGKTQKVETAGGTSSQDAYNAAASKAQQTTNPYGTKGYPKPK